MIDSSTRRKLVAVARAALAARVRGESMPPPPADLQITGAGAFVTVYCSGELRGCLGSLEADGRLAETIVRLAADVACEDYRFPPLVPHELDGVTVDISVLTPSVAVTDPSTIVVGRDGLIVELGRRRGLLLPQVAVEHE